MAKVIKERVTAEIEGDFVVFLIGMRVNRIWKLHKWLPVFFAMPRMLIELRKNPESGFIGMQPALWWRMPVLIQYWRSFEDLERYARAKDANHYPAWVNFNRRIGSNGDVGFFHETFRGAAGQSECIYNNMPAMGLAAVTKVVPASGYRTTAAGRLGQPEQGEACQ